MGWPQEVERDIGEWTTTELQVGDLVFGQKDSGPLAWLCGQADEPWRHVGSLIDDDGELKLVEVLGDSFRMSELSAFFDPTRYVRWGAVRLGVQPECVAAANQWMRDHLEGGDRADHVYAWDDLILAGVISASRRGLLAAHPERVRAAIAAAGAFCKENLEYKDKTSLTCSSFIQFAYEHAGSECTIEHRRWRSQPRWPERSPRLDEIFDMSIEDLASFDELSVIDLYLEADRIDRGTATTKARPAHVVEAFKGFAAAVGGFVIGESPPDGLGVDSRWVTPGDLWRSPSVYQRAFVTLR